MERLITLWIGYLREYETIYLQTELGLLDETAMERLGWGGLRELPALHYLWPRLGIVVGPSFREYVAENWSDVPALATGLHIEP